METVSPLPAPRQSPMRRSQSLTRRAWKRRRKTRTDAERDARDLVEARANNRCEGCGRPGRCEWSHRVARSQGGPFTAENGLWLCGDLTGGRAPTTGGGCHPWAHSATGRPVAERRGWILRRHQNPALTPALVHPVGLVLLAADGGYIPVPPTR